MKTCPDCQKVYADKYRSCPSCAGAALGGFVKGIATWSPFLMFSLIAIGLLGDASHRVAGVMLVMLAALIFPPSFRRLPGPTLAKLAVAAVLFIMAISFTPSDPGNSGSQVAQANPPTPSETDVTRSPPPERTARVARTDRPHNVRTIKGRGAIGCVERSRLEQLTRLAVDGDRVAWQKSLLAAYLSQECTPLKLGTAVFIQDTAIFSGLIKVRRQGETVGYWTTIEEVD